jgi:hypothetical protein
MLLVGRGIGELSVLRPGCTANLSELVLPLDNDDPLLSEGIVPAIDILSVLVRLVLEREEGRSRLGRALITCVLELLPDPVPLCRLWLSLLFLLR